ncbi:MAG: hypothetical protein EPN46_06370 [Candidimonas sp.]|nr:MAG: hypothetical protein EPN77_01325 [Candidimonas sp.]TAM25918.1 MAG: hypothetical protein EPN62_02825 [Candidimonas sp.]TAM77402.1 MAG: hypothetical protein EPN46_06370 [Candidimonas sp.]
MRDQEWGYEFDMKELESGQFQASYWLISPAGELTEPIAMPVRESREDSLDEAQAAGKAAAASRSQQSTDAPDVKT